MIIIWLKGIGCSIWYNSGVQLGFRVFSIQYQTRSHRGELILTVHFPEHFFLWFSHWLYGFIISDTLVFLSINFCILFRFCITKDPFWFQNLWIALCLRLVCVKNDCRHFYLFFAANSEKFYLIQCDGFGHWGTKIQNSQKGEEKEGKEAKRCCPWTWSNWGWGGGGGCPWAPQ